MAPAESHDGSVPTSLVSQGFDRVEAGGSDGGYHAADESNGNENEHRYHQCAGIDHQPDVTRFGILGHGTVKGQASHRYGHHIGKNNSEDPARKCDGERFSEVASVGPAATTYRATGLARGTTYYFRVRAYNSAGNSNYSDTASATTKRKKGL